jgi:hypothetical protein
VDRLVVDVDGRVTIGGQGNVVENFGAGNFASLLKIVGAVRDSTVRNYNYGVNSPNYEGLVAGGSETAPSAVLSGRIVAFKLLGHNGTSFVATGAQIRLRTSQDWSGTARGTEMEFRVTPNNTTAEISALNISNSGQVIAGYGMDVTGSATFRNGVQITGSSNITSGGLFISNQLIVGTDIYSFGAGADRVGILNAAGAGAGSTYVGLRYDSGNNRAELAALSGGVAWRDVVIAPNAKAVFGDYTAAGGLTINGYVEIKSLDGTVRRLATV